ncbi:hypothetical protein SUGI_0530380 [Cryptomeria japonica]|nr:hypothetical protein SUGI_0530380 [Cryptomeria japonica]
MLVELVLVLMVAVRLTSATQYKVGDADGWRIGKVNYTAWAESNDFYVGDSLLFLYNKTWHNVLQVTENDYDSCKNSSPIATYEGGNNILPLSKAGLYYYLCGITGHCEAGQKVAINVLAANGSAPSSSPETAPSPANDSAPSSSASVKPKSAAPSPSPSASASSPKSSHVPANAPAASASRSSAHVTSAGSALLAFIWVLGALLFCL